MKVLSVLARVYVPLDALDSAIAFYEDLFDESCRLRFSYPTVGLELAQVGAVLMIAGSDAALEPFRATRATFMVEGLEDFELHLKDRGAEILSRPKPVPTGRNMRVRHPDGLVAEYVEHAQPEA